MAMPPDKQPRQVLSVRAKRLAASLKHYRIESGLKQAEVAGRFGWSEAKVGHLERARNFAEVADVELLLDLYGVPDGRRERMLTWAREARRRNWWNEYEDVYDSGYLALEDEASGIDDWCPLLIPGLIQTRDYARALFEEAWDDGDWEEAERRLQARMLRQAILLRPDAPRLRIVLDEAVLYRPIGGIEVMRAQLNRLVTEAEREFISVQVLPRTQGVHPGLSGPLIILHFNVPKEDAEGLPADPDVGYVEGFHGATYLESAKKVVACNVAMKRMRELALSPEESAARIEAAARAL